MLAAASGSSDRSREALARLCEAYWFPLYAFIRKQGSSPEDAADLTQGYLVRLLDKSVLSQVTPGAGRFRSFLFASVKHYLANERDRDHARKRGGGMSFVPLDTRDAEEKYAFEPSDDLTPERVFERKWATTVLERAMARLRADLTDGASQRRFEILRPYLLGDESGGYREAAAKLGVSDSAVAVAVHRLRKQFGVCLRDEITDTVASPEDVESEIRHLLGVLGG